ncbi:MAG: ABC transporter permease, partial [bacterium]
MLQNYLKIALRTIFKHRLFSFINIFGLALSLSFCMLVIVIINDQNSFDRFHPRENDIYRMLTVAHRKSGGTEKYASSPRPLGVVLETESASVEKVVQLTRGLFGDAKYGQVNISISGFFTDRVFFDVFGFRLAKGDPATALELPNTIVLTAETAEKFFGDEDPLGKTVSIDRLTDFIVTGVLQPLNGKTHFVFDALASSASLAVLEKENKIRPVLEDWKNYYANYNYLRLHQGNAPGTLQPLLSEIPGRFYGNQILESRDKGYSFELQPLTGITPGPILSNNLGRAMPEMMLVFLSVLAFIGMVAAVFNYTNLTMARSLTRAKEVGVRKVTGALRRQLFLQFVVESIFIVLLALSFALLILKAFLIPGFQQLQLSGSFDLDFIIDYQVVLFFLGLSALIGLIAGLLPATFMSAFRPAQILSDLSKIKVLSKITLRKVLIVFQFVLAITLIIIVTAVYKQIDYA